MTISTVAHNMTEQQKKDFSKMFHPAPTKLRPVIAENHRKGPGFRSSGVNLASLCSKMSVKGFQTTGSVERKVNNPKHPEKTTLSTTKATLKLFLPYNK